MNYWRKPDRFNSGYNYSQEYLDYIKSDEFQYRKNEAWGLEGGCCAMCGKHVSKTTNKKMNFHHINHYRGDLNDIRTIICICPLCHAIEHGYTIPYPGQYDPRTPEAKARLQMYLDKRTEYINDKTYTMKWDNTLASRMGDVYREATQATQVAQ